MSLYDDHLDANPANFVPLSPVSFVERSASYSWAPSRSPAPVYSLSQTSTTTGTRPCSALSRRSASAITGANSRPMRRWRG